MKERPILFSAPMVRAILSGNKTQTRRVLKNAPSDTEFFSTYHHPDEERRGQHFYAGSAGALTSFAVPCPYGQPGDNLWVRETWQHANSPNGHYYPGCACFYRADYWDDPHGMDGEKSLEGKYRTWIPSIHMPRSVSRISLEVVSVRIERLNEISESDAQAEGCCLECMTASGDDSGSAIYGPGGYVALWESINGKGSWQSNPWVWVIGFVSAQSAIAKATGESK